MQVAQDVRENRSTHEVGGLHAKVAIEGHDRADLERLCGYIARPALASERLSIDPDGCVVNRL